MKLVDANLLLYAVDESSPHHRAAKAWLEQQLSGSETTAFAWAVLLGIRPARDEPAGLLRATVARRGAGPRGPWLAQPSATIVHPTDRHSAILRELLEPLGTAGSLTSDGHLAALSVEHGADLCSADADFSRFPRVRWVNPLQPA